MFESNLTEGLVMPDILEMKNWGILFVRVKDGNCTQRLGFGACSKLKTRWEAFNRGI